MKDFVGPIRSDEEEIAIDPRQLGPVGDHPRQVRHPDVDGSLFEPQLVPGAKLDIVRVVGVRNHEVSVAERDLDREQDRASVGDVPAEILEQLPARPRPRGVDDRAQDVERVV